MVFKGVPNFFDQLIRLTEEHLIAIADIKITC